MAVDDPDRCSWCGRADAPGARVGPVPDTDTPEVLICEVYDNLADDPWCVFCERRKDEVGKLIGVARIPKGMAMPAREDPARPGRVPAASQAFIRDECVEMCVDILREEREGFLR